MLYFSEEEGLGVGIGRRINSINKNFVPQDNGETPLSNNTMDAIRSSRDIISLDDFNTSTNKKKVNRAVIISQT